VIGKQIGQVKEKISKERGWEATQQKLIYSGMFEIRNADLSPRLDVL
jgi:hypothetical protein